MLMAGYGRFRDVRSGEKNGRSYCLMELGADDYRSLTVFVPDNLRSRVKSFSEGDDLTVQVTFESVYGKGTQATLKDVQLKSK